MKPGYVYILTNRPGGVLYIGVTDDLARRIAQHRSRAVAGFTRKDNCERLVWFERFDDIHEARALERRMKKWKREWKIKRVEELNPAWRDLFEEMNLFA
jgi:putative endonuclease